MQTIHNQTLNLEIKYWTVLQSIPLVIISVDFCLKTLKNKLK